MFGTTDSAAALAATIQQATAHTQKELNMETTVSQAVGVDHGNHHDADYDAFLARMNARFLVNVENGAASLFETDAEGLFDAYLATFAEGAERQYHTCHACRQFVDRFGSLVTIDADGRTSPAIWNEDDAPPAYREAIAAMARLVRRAKVTSVFLSSERVWGQPETGVWHHLSVTPPASMVYARGVLTAGQKMAERREDFKTVMHALNEFTQPMIDQALTLLRTDSLYRSEKVLGQADWLNALHVARAAALGPAKANVVWRAIAAAPAGFCHPRSSMIGTLLEDIAAGMEFSEVSRRFAAKMHPLSYQRPQAAPAAGAIAAAEKLVEQMGIARSLERRFARLEDIETLWKPAPDKPAQPSGVVFGHLAPKGAATAAVDMKIPPVTMTWDKFQRIVLPTAQRIEILAPASGGSYTSLVTAVHADAPPILQWDHENRRNPVSWYFWHGGSTAAQFGLTGGHFHRVTAVALKPPMWGDGGFSHQGKGVAFIIEGAKDSRNAGSCLFPEIMKSELHGVRSVIEAHSRSAKLAGQEEQSAAGLMFHDGKGGAWDCRLRVTAGGKAVEYRLDRWD